MKDSRNNFSASEKVAILRRHLLEGVAVSTLCDQHSI
jgi:transposase-like protein